MILRLALCLALLAPPLAAQSLDSSGDVILSATDLDDGQPVAKVDVTFGLRLRDRLTVEAGTFAYVLRGKRPHETYVSLAWHDTWRAGVVRPAYDRVLPSVFADVAPYLAYERTEYTRAFATSAAMRRTAVPWGVSWQGQSGALGTAVSLHSASKGGFRSASLSLDWQGTGWDMALAAELVDPAGPERARPNVKLGGHVQTGPATLGLALLHPEASNRPDTLAIDLAAPVTPRITLHAMTEQTRAHSDDAWGLAADADLGHGRHLRAAATRAARATGLHLSLAQRF